MASCTSALTDKVQQLRTERLITCRQNAPKWVLALLGGQNTSHVHEVSYVDPAAQRVTLCSTNMSWTNVLSVRETVVYQPLPSAPDSRTQFKQDAKITALCGGWQKVKNCIEEATAERFDQNARAGREGFEHVLQISRRVFGEEREKQQLQQQREPPQRRRQHRQEHTA